MRKDLTNRLPPREFIKLYNMVDQYVNESEDSCGHRFVGLRATIASQAKSFFATFHAEKLAVMAMVVDNDPWEHALVPIEFQHIVHAIETGRMSSIDGQQQDQPLPVRVAAAAPDDADGDNELGDGGDETRSDDPLASASSSSAALSAASAPSDIAQVLMVGDTAYPVVSAVLMLVKAVAQYLECALSIPSLSTDATSRLVDLFRQFNQHVANAILGARARESSGLANVTTKHLALAFNAVGAVDALVNPVRALLQTALRDSRIVLLGEFDGVRQVRSVICVAF